MRSRRLPWIALLPLLAVGYLLATTAIPSDHRTLLDAIRYLLLPAELALILALVVAARRTLARQPVAHEDLPTRLRRSAAHVLGNERAASILSTEIALFYYAFRPGQRRSDVTTSHPLDNARVHTAVASHPVPDNATSSPIGDGATSSPIRNDATSSPIRNDATSSPIRNDATSSPIVGAAPQTSDVEARSAGHGSYTTHRESNAGTWALSFTAILLLEAVPLHLLLQTWSETAAWMFSALSAYGIVWLLGDYRALAARPLEIRRPGNGARNGGVLRLRTGIRWEVDIPVEHIRNVERIRSVERAASSGPKGRVLNLAAWGEANVQIELKQPVEVTGMYGIRRSSGRLAIHLDDPDSFCTDLTG